MEVGAVVVVVVVVVPGEEDKIVMRLPPPHVWAALPEQAILQSDDATSCPVDDVVVMALEQ